MRVPIASAAPDPKGDTLIVNEKIRFSRAVVAHRRAVEKYGTALRAGADADQQTALLTQMRLTDLELTEATAPFLLSHG